MVRFTIYDISKINTKFVTCCIYKSEIVPYNNNYRNEHVCFLYFVELSLFYQEQKKITDCNCIVKCIVGCFIIRSWRVRFIFRGINSSL